MARLDRLGPAKEVAQIGSVIGRGFSYKLLKAVAGMDEAPLEAALEKLSDADIVLVEGVLPESDYRFKHALIQDAAYENLLKSRRQVLHRRIAEVLRDRFADKAAGEPEVLAHHFTQAGLTDVAIEWWGKAGDQALRRSAFQEAISHLGKAIEMADKTSEGSPRAAAASAAAAPSQRLKLQTSYGQALSWGKGYAAPETAAAFARARDLAASNDVPPERFATLYGQWSVSILRADLVSARQLAEVFLADAEKAARLPEVAAGRRMSAITCCMQGAFAEAQIYSEGALRIYDPGWDRDTKFRTNHDTGATATMYLALASWILGDANRARKLVDDATWHALDCNHVPTATTTGFFKALFETIGDRAETTRTDAKALIQLAREHATPTFLAFAIIFQGWACARLGERDAGIADLREGLTDYVRQGNRAFLPLFWGLLAEIEAEGHGAEGALTRVDEALALVAETGEHWTDSFLHRIRGEILLKRDPSNTAPAEEAFLAAIAVAQQQKAKSFELQAALSLAKLYQSTSRPADAHAVLAPALEGFSATPEFPEIAEAQALLAALPS
jgi:predicted ATPase